MSSFRFIFFDRPHTQSMLVVNGTWTSEAFVFSRAKPSAKGRVANRWPTHTHTHPEEVPSCVWSFLVCVWGGGSTLIFCGLRPAGHRLIRQMIGAIHFDPVTQRRAREAFFGVFFLVSFIRSTTAAAVDSILMASRTDLRRVNHPPTGSHPLHPTTTSSVPPKETVITH